MVAYSACSAGVLTDGIAIDAPAQIEAKALAIALGAACGTRFKEFWPGD
jgi:hypothetical protein